MMNISTTLFGEISHASLFFTGQLRNPWQMLAERWGSAEPRLKNTALDDAWKVLVWKSHWWYTGDIVIDKDV